MTSTRPYLMRAFYDWIADNKMTPYILVDADAQDVGVPDQYVVDGQIVLNVGGSAVRELQIGNTMVSFSARFGGTPFEVRVPLQAVKAIYAKENGKGMVFSDDDDFTPSPTDPTDPSGRGNAPHLKLVK